MFTVPRRPADRLFALHQGALEREIPTGFITIAGRPIVERSIDALRAAGIERIRIVIGHLAAQYDADPIDEPYLLVESDLLYDARARRLLVDAPFQDLLLASGATRSGDEAARAELFRGSGDSLRVSSGSCSKGCQPSARPA
jgi:choline kinase